LSVDRDAAEKSVRLLNAWGPQIAATGHGVPMSGPQLEDQLATLAMDFERLAMPRRGRYVRQAAVANEEGVVSIRPPVADSWPKIVGTEAALVAGAAVIGYICRRRSRAS
jgi:hypothetical protein